jgi:hypothetical protein
VSRCLRLICFSSGFRAALTADSNDLRKISLFLLLPQQPSPAHCHVSPLWLPCSCYMHRAVRAHHWLFRSSSKTSLADYCASSCACSYSCLWALGWCAIPCEFPIHFFLSSSLTIFEKTQVGDHIFWWDMNGAMMDGIIHGFTRMTDVSANILIIDVSC